ncbi:MAG: FAD:protein FMN transferase, partial [Candidatus Moraniibacteriota bacterium]
MNRSNQWKSASYELRGEIMKTDIYCEIQCEEAALPFAQASLKKAFKMFREFEGRYSRFRKDNALWRLNQSDCSVVSPELFSLLESAKKYHTETGGLFDP